MIMKKGDPVTRKSTQRKGRITMTSEGKVFVSYYIDGNYRSPMWEWVSPDKLEPREEIPGEPKDGYLSIDQLREWEKTHKN